MDSQHNSRRESLRVRTFTRIVVSAVVTVSALIAVTQSANASQTDDPYAIGNNAAGYGFGFTSNDFHDIDRKKCGFWGCNYDDGTNVFYSVDGTGTVYRGMACGTHRYRHQSSDGGSENEMLTRDCS